MGTAVRQGTRMRQGSIMINRTVASSKLGGFGIGSKMANHGAENETFVLEFDDLTEEMKQTLISKKLSQVETNFEKKLRNLKPIIFAEARQFIKDQSMSITEQFTKHH